MKIKKEVSAGGIIFKIPKKFDKNINNVEWLLIQHSGHKGWTFPKGLVGDHLPDETKEEAALREVQEEGGVKAKIIDPEPIQSHYTYKWDDTLVKKTVYYFLMQYISGNPENHDWEVSQAIFLPTAKVIDKLTFPSDKEVFKKILLRFQKYVKRKL